MEFRCVLLDPPWTHAAPGWLGGAAKEYDRLSVEQIAALPLSKLLADDAHCWLWSTEEHLPAAFSLLRKWGLTRKALFPWVKLTQDRTHLAWPGGYYGRCVTEYLLFAMRGKLPIPHGARQIRRILRAPQGKKHSEKPVEAMQLIESWSPQPRLELFARTRRDGWTAWGKEIPDSAAALGLPFDPHSWLEESD